MQIKIVLRIIIRAIIIGFIFLLSLLYLSTKQNNETYFLKIIVLCLVWSYLGKTTNLYEGIINKLFIIAIPTIGICLPIYAFSYVFVYSKAGYALLLFGPILLPLMGINIMLLNNIAKFKPIINNIKNKKSLEYDIFQRLVLWGAMSGIISLVIFMISIYIGYFYPIGIFIAGLIMGGAIEWVS